MKLVILQATADPKAKLKGEMIRAMAKLLSIFEDDTLSDDLKLRVSEFAGREAKIPAQVSMHALMGFTGRFC